MVILEKSKEGDQTETRNEIVNRKLTDREGREKRA